MGLRLISCSGLTELPSLDRLTALQKLYLNGCRGLTSQPDLDTLRRRGVTVYD